MSADQIFFRQWVPLNCICSCFSKKEIAFEEQRAIRKFCQGLGNALTETLHMLPWMYSERTTCRDKEFSYHYELNSGRESVLDNTWVSLTINNSYRSKIRVVVNIVSANRIQTISIIAQ